EHALQGAVLAGPAMQHVERHIRLQGLQHSRDVAPDVDLGDAVAFPLESVRARLSGTHTDLALSRPATHQDSDVLGRWHTPRVPLSNCARALLSEHDNQFSGSCSARESTERKESDLRALRYRISRELQRLTHFRFRFVLFVTRSRSSCGLRLARLWSDIA